MYVHLLTMNSRGKKMNRNINCVTRLLYKINIYLYMYKNTK